MGLVSNTLSNTEEYLVFFKRWMKSPKQLGTMAPISTKLAKAAALSLENPEKLRVIEIGAGTGKLTRELLNVGVKPENLICVELDRDLSTYLQQSLPHVCVVQGDACYLDQILPEEWLKTADIVFSSIPFMYLPLEIRQKIADSSFSVLKSGGKLYHLTYNLWSPLTHPNKRKVVSVWANIPPGFVWEYTLPHQS